MRCSLTVRLLVATGWLTLCGCRPMDWSEGYHIDGKDPYDLYALYELLEARPPGLTLLSDSADLAQLHAPTGTSYVFVGHHPYYDTAAVTALLGYVERGNTAILATGEVPEDLARHLFGADCYAAPLTDGEERFPATWADSVTGFLYPAGDSFPLVNIRYWEAAPALLRTMNDQLLCDPAFDLEVMGSLDTLGVNFLRVGWGAGNFYLFTTPRYLTNWYVLDSTMVPYPAAVLSVLDTGRVYWDEHHRRYRQDPAAAAADPPPAYTGGRNLLQGNPTLRYIQQHRALALAWYLIIAGGLLYILFRGKRRQRVIPVVAPRPNASRRLIDTISRLSYQQGNHAALARREVAQLRFHLAHRRGVNWREGEPPPADLSARLGLSAAVADRALAEILRAGEGKVLREKDLLRFYRAIAPLYR